MKYFIAIEEDLLQQLWAHDPSLVVPFSRPICPRPITLKFSREAQALLPVPEQGEAHSTPDE